ncbi:MAG: magnesium transporter, partial [Alphaproteobacteria bacterium]|nr:magnesium transporter [Alphaproteobacteria bacterium]
MLWVYVPHGTTLERKLVEDGSDPPENAVWIDLVTPTQREDKLVERLLGIAVPTREEMQEIEVSSRLYVEHHARYMTATLMCNSDTATPKTTPVTFILSGHRLVTVRYDDPRPFQIVGNKLARSCPTNVSGETVLLDLLDAVIDRAADILERIGMEVDRVSHDIFEPEAAADQPLSYKDILKAIGSKGDLTSKVRESLVSIGRLLLFLANEAEGMRWHKDVRLQLQAMQRDVLSLSDHATYLTNKITFLLDAMLGVVT